LRVICAPTSPRFFEVHKVHLQNRVIAGTQISSQAALADTVIVCFEHQQKGDSEMTDRELMSMAKEASMNAYVPYSRFPVGAAIECDDGAVFTGCNVENAALGSTICAERTACCKAVSEGHRSFRRIAIYADSENWCTPCGACRQFLAEFSPDMEVLCARAGDRYVSYKLSELMPHVFAF